MAYLCRVARKKCKAKVVFSQYVESYCYPSIKVIYINSRLPKRTKIAYLAHELGHILSHKKHPNWVLEKANRYGKLCILEEEFCAWAEADILMFYLDLYDITYLRIKHMALKQYYIN